MEWKPSSLEWLRRSIRRNRNCSLGCSLYEFQQVANDSVRSTVKPHGSQHGAQQTQTTELRKHQQKRLQKQTTGAMRGEGVIWEGINQSAAEQHVWTAGTRRGQSPLFHVLKVICVCQSSWELGEVAPNLPPDTSPADISTWKPVFGETKHFTRGI